MNHLPKYILTIISLSALALTIDGRPNPELNQAPVQEANIAPRKVEAELLELRPDYLIIELKFPPIDWQANGDSVPDIPQLMHFFQTGEPPLPVSMHLLQVPPGGIKVSLLESDQEIHKYKRIPPWQGDSEESEYQEKPAVYGSDRFHPLNIVEIQSLGSFRGRKIACLQANPLRYNPRRNEVIYYSRMKIRVDFSDIQGIPGGRLGAAEEKTLLSLLNQFPQTTLYPTIAPNPPPQPEAFSGEEGIKIAVSAEGLYRITYQTLTDSGINPLLMGDPRNFKLINRGDEVPIYIYGETDGRFDPGDYIDFWGIPNRETYIEQSPDMYSDPWSDVNIYWLFGGENPGAHMVEESVEISQLNPAKYYRPYNYSQTLHFEEDHFFFRLGQVAIDTMRDHNYYDDGIDANETKLYTFWLNYPDTTTVQTAQVKVVLMGYTYPVPNSNIGYHYATASVNNYSSNAMSAGAPEGSNWPWVGQTLWIIETEGSQGVPHQYLHHGNNTLGVTNWGNTPSGNNNTILTNWFAITYPRRYTPYGGYIHFTAPQNGPVDTLYNFVIEEFPSDDIIVYKIGSSRLTNYSITQNPLTDGFRLTFQDRLYGGEEFVALTTDSLKSPAWILADQPSTLASPANQAEMIIIAHSSFMENQRLQDLIQLRSQEGTVMLVDVSDIYDEFNWGIQSPEAIRDFLQFAYYYWSEPKPFHVLLAGDGSWDQKDLGGYGGNLIPSYYLQTKDFGYSASDFWFTLLDGDDYIPEMTIGRIPAREEEELEFYIEKVMQNEQEPIPGFWHNRYLFVSGGENGEVEFQQRAQAAINLLPHLLFVERLEMHDAASPYFGGTVQLNEFFNTGISVVCYNGHGAGSRWGTNLFTVANAGDLNNDGMYPFVANFTCYICQYDARAPRTTLGEELLFEENKGALGVYGSTGLGWLEAGNLLQQSLSTLFNTPERFTQGELVLLSKINYLGTQFGLGGSGSIVGETHATIFNMILLGDPAALVMTPQYRSEIDIQPVISNAGDIDIQAELPFNSGMAVMRVYDQNSYAVFSGGALWQTYPFTFSQGTLQYVLNPSVVEVPEQGSFRISYFNQSSAEDGTASADFYTAEYFINTEFDSLALIPDPVSDADSLKFSCIVLDLQGLNWVKAVYTVREFTGGEIVFTDTVDMHLIDSDSLKWETFPQPPLIGYAEYRLDFSAKAEDGEGNLATSSAKTRIIVSHQPDLFIDSTSITLCGDHEIMLSAQVGNLNYNDVDSVEVEFWAGNEKIKSQLIGAAWISQVKILEPVTAYISPNPPFEDGVYQVHVMVDQDSLIEDANYNNNSADVNLTIDHFQVTPATGSNVNEINRTFYYLDEYRFNISPGAVVDSTLLIAQKLDGLTIQQSGLAFFDTSDGLLLSFSAHSDTLLSQDGLTVGFRFTIIDTSFLDSMAVHYRHSTEDEWTKLSTIFSAESGGYMWAQADCGLLGVFALLSNADNSPPEVEITIDGQIYSPGGYIPTHPRINAIFHDLGGVNPNSLWAMVDGDTIAKELLMPAVIVGECYSVTTGIHEILSSGSHVITFGGDDFSGNQTVQDFQMKVAGGFDFKFAGNYPNPFKTETIFAYSLTDQPDGDIVVKIYTVAGRLIKTIRQPAKINYDEIIWDGRDDLGKNLANGVYFCRIKAHKGNETVEKMLKLAKVR